MNLLQSIPYGIIYQLRKEMLLIAVVAGMHLGREPETWDSRLKPKELGIMA
jgi:hypothetical protein